MNQHLKMVLALGCMMSLGGCLPTGGGGGGGGGNDGGTAGTGGSGGGFGGFGAIGGGDGGAGGGGAGGAGGGVGGIGGDDAGVTPDASMGGAGGGVGGAGGGMDHPCVAACDTLADCAAADDALCPGVQPGLGRDLSDAGCLAACGDSPELATVIEGLGSCQEVLGSVLEVSAELADACDDGAGGAGGGMGGAGGGGGGGDQALCESMCAHFSDCVDPNCNMPIIDVPGCVAACLEDPNNAQATLDASCDLIFDSVCGQPGAAGVCDCGPLPETNVGAACASQDACEGGDLDAICISDADGWPGGYCSALNCVSNVQCGADAVCVVADAEGTQICMQSCNDLGCRDGYDCVAVSEDGTVNVCAPPQ